MSPLNNIVYSKNADIPIEREEMLNIFDACLKVNNNALDLTAAPIPNLPTNMKFAKETYAVTENTRRLDGNYKYKELLGVNEFQDLLGATVTSKEYRDMVI